MTRFTGRNQAAIVGYAQTPIERHAKQSLGALTMDVTRRAVSDAGLSMEQIDGFVTVPLFPTLGSHAVEDGVSIVTAQWLAQHLNLRPRLAAGIQGGGQLPGSVAMAVEAIVSGSVDYVVVHRALHNPHGRYHENTKLEAHGSSQWTMPQGFFGPIASIALAYNEYVGRYGVSRDALASIVVEARKNGSRIPWSHWHGRPITAQDYLGEPQISEPICRLDCDIPVDGVTAFVLTSADRARDLPHAPVYVSGYATGMPPRRRAAGHWPLDDIMEGGREATTAALGNAGLAASEIDLPQLYDGFSPLVLFWLEALGLCPLGEGHRYVADGNIDSDRPGALPVLSSGGALGNGRMHGTPQMLECYLQLSRRAGDRQRDGVTTALACQGIPHLGGLVVYSANAS
jgi:acetyl-CoA acetyltransferase